MSCRARRNDVSTISVSIVALGVGDISRSLAIFFVFFLAGAFSAIRPRSHTSAHTENATHGTSTNTRASPVRVLSPSSSRCVHSTGIFLPFYARHLAVEIWEETSSRFCESTG